MCLFHRRMQNYIIILSVSIDDFTDISTSKTLQKNHRHPQDDLLHQAARRTCATPRMDDKNSRTEIYTHPNQTPYNMLSKKRKWTCRTVNKPHTTPKRHSTDQQRQTNQCPKSQKSTSSYLETSNKSQTPPDWTYTMLQTDYRWQPKHRQRDIGSH